MCTAAAEAAEAAPGPYALSDPAAQKMYATAFVTYIFALKWQAGDRKLAKQLAELAPPASHAEPVRAPAARGPRRGL